MSREAQTIHGRWEHEGMEYRDELVRVFVDVPPTEESRRFFVEFKEVLKRRFQQIEIWIVTFPIDAV